MKKKIHQSDIKPCGYINSNFKENIIILNNDDAIMYDELYDFKSWPSINFDMIAQKLSGTSKYTFTEIWGWMNEFEINGKLPQFVVVRDDIGLYTIYCNYYEALIYFRNKIFNSDVILISVNLKVNLNGSHDDKKYKLGYYQVMSEYSDTIEYIEEPIMSYYNKIIGFLDLELERQEYGYAYIPEPRIRTGIMETVVESSIYILDRLTPTKMKILDGFEYEFDYLGNQDDISNNVYGFLKYDKLPTQFGKYPRIFWYGGL